MGLTYSGAKMTIAWLGLYPGTNMTETGQIVQG